MSYMVIDLETTIRNTVGNNKGSSHCKENEIVYFGCKEKNKRPAIMHFRKEATNWRRYGVPCYTYSNMELLVGHNIKFDLLYLLRQQEFKEKVFPRILIWDTALVEYIITGQDHKFPSLDNCAVKYGGTVKPSKIKELWDSGVDTDDIDYDMMVEYLTGDIINTEKVFLAQWDYCVTNGIMPLTWSQMLALKATTMIEHNGMFIDRAELSAQKIAIACKKADIMAEIYKKIYTLHPVLNTMPVSHLDQFFNIDSPQFLSKVLFGGTCEYIDKEQVGFFKTGKRKGEPKYVNKTNLILLQPLITLSETETAELKTAKTGIYKVGEDELNYLLDSRIGDSEVPTLIELLLEYRGINKELGTYIEGLEDAIYDDDDCIHGNVHHTSTHTGRTSSSGPNLQNFTN